MEQSLLDVILEEYQDEQMLTADGFDEAVIGIDYNSNRLIYSVKKCIEILESQGMTQEDALEYFEYNVGSAYVGELTPIWCKDFI
jgi:hypothetical protein